MKVSYSIECRWTHQGYEGEVEVSDADLEGLSGNDRDALIDSIVGEAVAEQVSWGWHEN